MSYQCRSLIATLFVFGISTNSTALEISPNHVTVGKAAQITLKNDTESAIKRVTLQPGGPVLTQTLPTEPGEYGNYQINKQGDTLLLQQRMGEHWLDAVQLGTTPQTSVSLGTQLVVANGRQGITVFDTQGGNPVWVSSHQKLGRVIRVTLADSHVLALNDANIIFLVDLKNPSEPTVINAWRSRNTVKNIAWFDQTVFALGSNGIEVIDFSAPMPQISNEGLDFGQGVNFGGERRVFIANDMAYVADWFSGIHIYDISNPHLPLLLSSFHTPGSPKGVVVRNNIAYIPDDDHGLQIIDVSNPRDPRQLGHIQTNGLAYTPHLVGDLLYLASHHGGFQIIDIRHPAAPKLVSEVNTDGKAWSLKIKDDIAYIADDDSGLLMFDVSNPAQPRQIGQFSPGGAAEEVLVRNDVAFVAFFDDGLYVLDIKDPGQPKIISHIQIPGNSRGLDLANDTLFVASWLAGIHTVDVSNLETPRILGQYDTRGATWGLQVKEGYLFAMDWWGGIAVIDVSDPTTPRTVGGYHNRGRINDIATRDKYAFVANGSNGLQVFDIDNPLNPTWMTGVNFNGDARDVELLGDYAYLAMGDGGFAIADISNPFQARWVSSTETDGIVSHIQIDAERAYLIDDINGTLIFDISQPLAPQQLAQIQTRANALIAENNGLIVADNNHIRRYTINAQNQAKLDRLLTIPGGAGHLVTDDNQLYASQGKTLLILDKNTLNIKKSIKLPDTITAINVNSQQLLVSSRYSVNQFDLQTGIQTSIHYPMLGKTSSLELHNGVAYMGGEKTITALRLIKTPILTGGNTLHLSPDIAEGSYHITTTYDTNIHITDNNALRVEMPKFSKPKITLEAFKKLLLEKRNSDIFVSPTQ